MFDNFKIKLKQKICKHKNTFDSSCPYTMRTYTYCGSCNKRVKVTQNS